MDDRYAQFLIAVGDLCVAAALAGLDIEARTTDGVRTVGVPGPLSHADGDKQFDEGGYDRTFRIDDRVMNLEEIVECTVRAPVDL
jgi:hypothetical protein